MLTYWEKRARIGIEATRRVGVVLGVIAWSREIPLAEEGVSFSEIHRAEEWGDTLVSLMRGIASRRAPAVLCSRVEALDKISREENRLPHCEDCKDDPRRPITYWDYRRYIDEQTFVKLCGMAMPELDGDGRLNIVCILTSFTEEREALSEEYAPATGTKH